MDKKNTKKPSFLFIGRSDEPILSKKNRKLLTDPLDDNNPITVQVPVSYTHLRAHET